MSASPWPHTTSPDGSIHLYPVGRDDAAAVTDDDEALDDWLASMTAAQFERALNLLIERLGDGRSALERLA